MAFSLAVLVELKLLYAKGIITNFVAISFLEKKFYPFLVFILFWFLRTGRSFMTCLLKGAISDSSDRIHYKRKKLSLLEEKVLFKCMVLHYLISVSFCLH